jgi:hypothetical protein
VTKDVTEALAELDRRIRRLEEKKEHRRRSLNLRQAAEFLNRSDEWLRRQHAMGRGPIRHRRGKRNWEYTIDNLETYALSDGEA